MSRADSRMKRAALVAAVAALAGCASHAAPPQWLSDARTTASSGWGGWIRMTVRVDSVDGIVGGELIAAHDDTVFVLAPGDSLRAIPHVTIRKAELVEYDPKQGTISAYAFLGVLSTVSHGFVLVLSAPAWMITGAVLTHVVVNEATTKSTVTKALRPYARFPQGIPAELDRSKLLPKPYTGQPPKRFW